MQAAKIVDINYSTAKTILFFYRNGDKSYQFEFKKRQRDNKTTEKAMASFVDISFTRDDLPEILSPTFPIDIISTIGSRQHAIEESKAFSASRNSYLFEKISICQEIKA